MEKTKFIINVDFTDEGLGIWFKYVDFIPELDTNIALFADSSEPGDEWEWGVDDFVVENHVYYTQDNTLMAFVVFHGELTEETTADKKSFERHMRAAGWQSSLFDAYKSAYESSEQEGICKKCGSVMSLMQDGYLCLNCSLSDNAKNRRVWFFHIKNDGSGRNYMSAEYQTTSNHEAVRMLEREYSCQVVASVLKVLSFHEYCGLVAASNIKGEHGIKVADAVNGVFFRST